MKHLMKGPLPTLPQQPGQGQRPQVSGGEVSVMVRVSVGDFAVSVWMACSGSFGSFQDNGRDCLEWCLLTGSRRRG